MNTLIPESAHALFIKLGERGRFEKESLQGGYLKLGYDEIDHVNCIEGKWADISEQIASVYKTNKSATTSHCNQIRKFYTEPEQTIWITFHDNKLWYCNAKQEIHLDPDGTKYRATIGGWKDVDRNGKKLEIANLSGRLTKVQGFRGTICEIHDKAYLIRMLNAQANQKAIELKLHQNKLIEDIEALMVNLHWKDFEVLVDLLFRASGWSRVGNAGGTIKNVDINLMNPITDEKAFAQVKSQSDLATYRAFCDIASANAENDKKFFAVHTVAPDLRNYLDNQDSDEDEVILLDLHKLASMCLNSGMVDWLITVVG